jgi:hypothetical protein
MADDPKQRSILDYTDEELIKHDIIRYREAVPLVVTLAFWLILSYCVLGGVALGLSSLSACAKVLTYALIAGIATLDLLVYVGLSRVLLRLHRQQLEIRVIASELPTQAATLVVKHMTPPELRTVAGKP